MENNEGAETTDMSVKRPWFPVVISVVKLIQNNHGTHGQKLCLSVVCPWLSVAVNL